MTYPYQAFREEVKRHLKDVLRKLYGVEEEIKLEKPKDIADLAFPCFSLSKQLKKSPVEIAKEIADSISGGKWIEKVEAINGYVNFFINKERISRETIRLVREMGDEYGKLEEKKVKVIVEHTSANPNGPLHVGRARNPIIGDTIARILRFGGYDVVTQYYVDDMGKQVATLFWGVKNLNIPVEAKKNDHRYVVFYQEANRRMEKDEEVRKEIEEIIKKCEEGDKKTLEEVREVYERVLEGMLESLETINIRIDEFVRESKFVMDGSVEEVIRKLAESPHAKRDGKAIYIDMEPFGVHGRNKRFYLTRSDGTSLYATRDIAYHLWKGENADKMINVLGEDHKLEARFVEIALKILDKKTPEVIFYSFISLPEGKMSTRKGRVVYLDDLIEEAMERARKEVKKRRGGDENLEYIARSVAVGAIRYNIIKVRPEKPIVFKWEEALNFEGQSAPFIQYAHARCCSIMRKIGTDQKESKEIEYEHESEINLLKMIALFPEIIEESIRERNPAVVAEYAFEIASSFNAFYRDCRVIGDEREEARVALVDAARQVIKNCLYILGIEALEEM
ncbi:MAG: arginine--tRNA ligase [Thermoplasmata archaeon]|nr:arginine--tRNA ligase [Thermoplasmata archaeon]